VEEESHPACLDVAYSTGYLAWQLLNLRLSDPMTLGLDRVRHIWIAGFITAFCAGLFVHHTMANYRTMQAFHRVAEKISTNPDGKSDADIFLDAACLTAFGGFTRL
jgi:hypothetical protein